MILADTLVKFAIRPDGWIHAVVSGMDLPRGPVGVLLYLWFVPALFYIPRHRRALYLAATSLCLTLVTVGPAYTLTLMAVCIAGWIVTRTLAKGSLYWLGTALLAAAYGTLLFHPQPYWLPRVDPHGQLYFYVHWAGLAYTYLRTQQVLIEISRGKLSAPGLMDFLAFLLFAPTLRMGPLYRYDEFHAQMNSPLRDQRRIGSGVLRMLGGIVRLGITGVLFAQLSPDVLFHAPETLSPMKFVLSVYAAPLAFYLWFSGYCELSIGVGRTMGFAVPDNFNYPWRAVNVAEFWQRWHITLSLWLKDYVFTPLIRRRWHFFWAFTLTFLLCGLWHGPHWGHIIWGTSQGIALAIVRVWSQYWKHQRKRNSPLYRRLARVGLVGGMVSSFLAWFITFHFEIVTIMIGMDLVFAGKKAAAHALWLLSGQ